MRILFIGQGYPGVERASSGSGVGTYLKNLTTELVARGHTCHVLLWSNDGCYHEIKKDGMSFYLVPHQYWPLVERVWPDSRDMWNLLGLVRKLDREQSYDRIEIQSEEGIANWVLRAFREKTILRVHTTLALMLQHKQVPITRKARFRLRREAHGFKLARRILTHSQLHAEELRREYPCVRDVVVVPHGVGKRQSSDLGGGEASGAEDAEQGLRSAVCGLQSSVCILVVGSADRRKGFDRIRPVLEAYRENYGPCRCVIVSPASAEQKREFDLMPPLAAGLAVAWRADISADMLQDLYAHADVFLHLARYESFGLPLIEAAAMGTPVVATRVGIAPELMEGELARFLVEGDDPVAVAHALAEVVARRDELGTVMRRRYHDQFTREAMAERWLRVEG